MNWPKIPYEHQMLPRGVPEQSRFPDQAQVNDAKLSTNGVLSQEDDSKKGPFQQYGDQKTFPSSIFTSNNHLRDSKGMMAQSPADFAGGMPRPGHFPNPSFQRTPFHMQAFQQQQQHPLQHQQLQQHMQRQHQQQQQFEHQIQQQLRQQQQQQQHFMKQKQMAQQQQQMMQQQLQQQHLSIQQTPDNNMNFFPPGTSSHSTISNGNNEETNNNNNNNTKKVDGVRKQAQTDADRDDGDDDDDDDLMSTCSKRSGDARMDGRNEGVSPAGSVDNDLVKKMSSGQKEDSLAHGHSTSNHANYFPPSNFLSHQYHPNFPYHPFQQRHQQKMDAVAGMRLMRTPSHHPLTSPPYRAGPTDLRSFFSPPSLPPQHPDQPPHNNLLPKTNLPPHSSQPSHLQRILQSNNNHPSPNVGVSLQREGKTPHKAPQGTSGRGDDADEGDEDSKNTSEDTICYEDEDGGRGDKSQRSKAVGGKKDGGKDGQEEEEEEQEEEEEEGEKDDDDDDDEDDDDTVDGNTTEDERDVRVAETEASQKQTSKAQSLPHTQQPLPFQPQHPYPTSSMPTLIRQNNSNPPNQPPNNLPNHHSNLPHNHPFNYHPPYPPYPPNHHSMPFPQKRYFDGEPVRPNEHSFSTQNFPQRPHPPPYFQEFLLQNYPTQHPRMPMPHQAFMPQRLPQHPFMQQQAREASGEGWRRDDPPPLESKPPSVDSFDESSTSDTQTSFPGKSSSHHEDSDRPSKKIKFDQTYTPLANYSDPRHINLCMQRHSKNEAFCRLSEMGGEEGRAVFLLELFSFMEERGTSITTTPTVSKQPLDLFKLYCIVKQFGGMVEVCKNKRWRDVSAGLKMGSSSSAGFVVKKNYGRFVFPFECMRDRGNIDPVPILAYLEQPLKKSNKRNNPDKSILDHPNLDPRIDFHSPRPSDPARRPQNSSGSSHSQYNDNHLPYQQPAFCSSSSMDAPMHHNAMNRGPRPLFNTDFEHLRMGLSPHKRASGPHLLRDMGRFPSACVESVRPVRKRTKRLNLRLMGQVDSWRVMMALRSGLLVETSWALNVLTGLLADDQATSQLKLSSLPGLLAVLLTILQSALGSLFHQDFKLPTTDRTSSDAGKALASRSDYDSFADLKESSSRESDDCDSSEGKGSNWRKEWRRRKDGCLLKDDRKEEFFMWDGKCWDVDDGGHDNTDHVMSHMEVGDDEEVMRRRFYGGREAFLRVEGLVKRKEGGVEGCEGEEERMYEFVRREMEGRLQEGGYIRDGDDLCGLDYSQGISCVEAERLHGEVFNSRDDHALEVERRCMQVLNIFRGLSFIPGNEGHLSRHAGLLFLLARLLLLRHEHRSAGKRHQGGGKEDSTLETCVHNNNNTGAFEGPADAKESACLQSAGSVCSWRTLESLREDALVIVANIAGRLDLSRHTEQVVLPLLAGLLHWCTCPSTRASDPDVSRNAFFVPVDPGHIQPSFFNLALEATSKMCVVDCNVDLLISTPPFARLLLFINHLCRLINQGAEGDHHFEDEMMMLTSSMSHLPPSNPVQQSFLVSSADWMSKQVSREFALVLVWSLLQADKSFAKLLTLDRNFVSSVLSFIEVQCLRLNLCILTSGSTSSDDHFSAEMLRKAASILLHVAQSTDHVTPHKHRLQSLIYDKLPPSCDDDDSFASSSSSCVNASKGSSSSSSRLPSILNEILLLCLHSH